MPLDCYHSPDSLRGLLYRIVFISGPGYSIIPPVQLESKLLSSSASDYEELATVFGTDAKNMQAKLSTNHQSRSLFAGEVHSGASHPGRQAFQQYPSPISPSKQVTAAYYLTKQNSNPSDGAEFLPAVEFLEGAVCGAATRSWPLDLCSTPFSSNTHAPNGDGAENASSIAYADYVFGFFTS